MFGINYIHIWILKVSTYSDSFTIGNSESEWVQLGRWSSQQTNLTQQTNIGGAS